MVVRGRPPSPSRPGPHLCQLRPCDRARAAFPHQQLERATVDCPLRSLYCRLGTAINSGTTHWVDRD